MDRLTRLSRLTCALLALITLASLPATVSAAQQDMQPLPPDGTAYGLKLADWGTAYFQWLFSIPKSLSPDLRVDPTGQNANLGQHAPVWFLPPHDGVGTTTFVIPEGQAVMVVPGFAVTTTRPGGETEEQLRAQAKANADFLHRFNPIATLDGVPIPDVNRYLVQTPLFNITLPPDSIVTPVTTGRVAAIGEGRFLLFPSLPLGSHVLHLQSDPKAPFKVDRTFNLIIQRPNEQTQ
jgi:hypothetical protein